MRCDVPIANDTHEAPFAARLYRAHPSTPGKAELRDRAGLERRVAAKLHKLYQQKTILFVKDGRESLIWNGHRKFPLDAL